MNIPEYYLQRKEIHRSMQHCSSPLLGSLQLSNLLVATACVQFGQSIAMCKQASQECLSRARRRKDCLARRSFSLVVLVQQLVFFLIKKIVPFLCRSICLTHLILFQIIGWTVIFISYTSKTFVHTPQKFQTIVGVKFLLVYLNTCTSRLSILTILRTREREIQTTSMEFPSWPSVFSLSRNCKAAVERKDGWCGHNLVIIHPKQR